MQLIEALHTDSQKWNEANRTAAAQVTAEVLAEKEKRGDRPATSRELWLYTSSNFGMGM